MLGGALNLLSTIIDKAVPDKGQAAKIKLQMLEMHQAGELAQLEVNKVEAQHGSIFVAGWRPFVGWVCGAAFAYAFLFQPLFSAVLLLCHSDVVLPSVDLTVMMPVLLGMLGLRTFEKHRGIDTKELN